MLNIEFNNTLTRNYHSCVFASAPTAKVKGDNPMSYQQQSAGVPEETARLCRRANRKGNPYMKLRDELGPLYEDRVFADLFADTGRPGHSPGMLAVVTVLQFGEGLTDRQAADAVRNRLDWKYLLGLEADDEGFDFTILTDFRNRLLSGEREILLLDAILDVFRNRRLLKARGRQRTDSTHVLAAVRVLNRLECAGETLRHALNELAAAEPDWLVQNAEPAWRDRYGARIEQYRLPKSDKEKEASALQTGADGFALLARIYSNNAPLSLRLPAVQTLARVWRQQYYYEDGQLRWRASDNLPPAELLILSQYDEEAHYSRKRDTE